MEPNVDSPARLRPVRLFSIALTSALLLALFPALSPTGARATPGGAGMLAPSCLNPNTALSMGQALYPLAVQSRVTTVAVVGSVSVLTMTLTVTNGEPAPSSARTRGAIASCPQTLSGVVLTDNLVSGATVVASEPLAERHGDHLVWRVGSIKPEQSVTVRLTLHLAMIDATDSATDAGRVTRSPLVVDQGVMAWAMLQGHLVTARAAAVTVVTAVTPKPQPAARSRAPRVAANPGTPLPICYIIAADSPSDDATATACPTPDASPTPIASPTTPATGTATTAPSVTGGATSSATAAATGTDTPGPTGTNTPGPTGTNTPGPTSTNTPGPTSTNTPGPTGTDTPGPTGTGTPGPTSTGTITGTATDTLTPTPSITSTSGPYPTKTSYPYPTDTPYNPTVSPTATSVDCSFVVAGWTFTPQSCPTRPGKSVVTVTITPPGQIKVDRALPLLSIVVYVDDNLSLRLSGPVMFPDMTLTLLGFRLGVHGISIYDDGLTIGGADLTMLSGANAPCSTNTPDGPGLILGSVTAVHVDGPDDGFRTTAGEITLQIYNAEVRAEGITLSQDTGFSADEILLRLPRVLSGRLSVEVGGSGLRISRDGSVGGAIDHFAFTLGQISASADGARFTPQGFEILQATLSIDIYKANTIRGRIDGLYYDGATLRLDNAEVELSRIEIGQITIAARAQLSLTIDGASGDVRYRFTGSATITLPHLRTFMGSVTLGSTDREHTTNLYAASFSFPTRVPILNTPLALTGLAGQLSLTRDKYIFALTAHVATLGDGYVVKEGDLFRGSVTGQVSTAGDFGLRGEVTLLTFLRGTSGLCVRFTADPLANCSDIIGNPNLVRGTGVYFEAQGGGKQSIADTLSLEMTIRRADGRIAQGPNGIDMSARFEGYGNFADYLSGNATGTIGTFIGKRGQRTLGAKAELTIKGPLGYAYPRIFVGLNGDIYLWNPDYYQLDAGDPFAQVLAPHLTDVLAGAGAAVAPARAALRRAPTTEGQATLDAPTAASPVGSPTATARGTFRIAPGQTNTLFVLTWRRGAPSLALIAPDGHIITARHPGHGVMLIDAPGRGARRGAALYMSAPPAGAWRVVIGGLRGGEAARFLMLGSQPQPELTMTEPARGQTAMARGAGGAVTLGGRVQPAAPGTTVSVYASPYTRMQPNAVAGAGILLSSDVPVHGGAWRYRWSTAAALPGRYTVYARLNNGTAPDVTAAALGTVLVAQPAHPEAPRRVRGVAGTQGLALRWLPPVRAALVAGYVVRWRAAQPRGAAWQTRDVGAARAVLLDSVAPNDPVQVQVAAYDLLGREGPWASIIVRRPSGTKRSPTGHSGHTPRRYQGPRGGAAPRAIAAEPAWPATPAVVSAGGPSGGGALCPLKPPPAKTTPTTPTPTGTPVPTATPGPTVAATTPFSATRWTLPGLSSGSSLTPPSLSSGVRVVPEDFIDGFARADIRRAKNHAVQGLSNYRIGFLTRSGSGALWRRSGVVVFFGPLSYVPAATAGITLSKAGAFRNYYCRPSPAHCDEVGRATGIVALISAGGLKSVREDPLVNPPGWITVPISMGPQLRAKGHLLANVLGGPPADPRNFVTLWQDPTNSPLMSTRETRIRDALRSGREPYIFYRVTPEYQGNDAIPSAVDLQAIGPNGYDMACRITNPPTPATAAMTCSASNE